MGIGVSGFGVHLVCTQKISENVTLSSSVGKERIEKTFPLPSISMYILN